MVGLSLDSIPDSSTQSGRRITNPSCLQDRGVAHYRPPGKSSRPSSSVRLGNHRVCVDPSGRCVGVVPADKETKAALKLAAARAGVQSLSVPEISVKLKRIASEGRRNLILIDSGKRGDSIYGSALANGLQVVSKVARDNGFTVKTFHLNNDRTEAILSEIQKGDIVGLSSTSPGHEHGIGFLRALDQRRNDVLILKGGKHESFAGADLQAKSNYPVDISFLGDADKTFSMVLDVFNQARSHDILEIQAQLEKIPGIAYAGRKNLSAEVRALGKNMVLPDFVDYQVLEPFSNFRNPNPEHKMLRVMDMRGCPEACTFCSISSLTTRMKSEELVAHIKEQIEQGYKQEPPIKIGYIMFEDGTFATSPKQDGRVRFGEESYDTKAWLKSFSQQMQELNSEMQSNYGHGLKFGIQTRADSFDENRDLLSWLKDAGLESVYLGVETLSNDPNDLKRLGKRSFRSTNLVAINQCHEAGVNVTASVMCELGREDKAIATVQELMKLGVNEIFTEFRKVYPDTGDAHRVIDQDGKAVKAEEISRRYSAGELHYGLPGAEDEMNLIVQAQDPNDPYSKLQIVDINELREASPKYYGALAGLASELGYRVDANGHYLKA